MSRSESSVTDASAGSSDTAHRDNPSFEDYHFDQGDHVTVDWSDGDGPDDEISGIAEDISLSAHEVIVSVVDYEDEQFANGQTYDAVPEWIHE